MFQKKKVKISNAKRSQHLKNKKNFSKPLKKKEQPTTASKKAAIGTGGAKKPTAGKEKVFGNPSVEKVKRKPSQKNAKFAPLAAPVPKRPAPIDSDDEKEDYNVQDMIDMIDDDEEKENYNQTISVQQKRKRIAEENDEDVSAKHFEKQYTTITEAENATKKRTVNLLPIKTKDGSVVTRSEEVEYNSDEEAPEPEDVLESDQEAEEGDSDDDVIKENAVSLNSL